jgi:type IV secretion system protein VirD4
VLDFADPTPATSAQWNPLVPVTAALAAGDLARASRAAWDLGHVLAADPGGPRTEPFWQQAQEALLAALALGVGDVAPPEAAHPASLFRTLTQYQDVLDGWFASFPDAHPARQAYGPVQQSADVTRMGILTTTTARLRLVADPQMAWLTSGHDPAWPMGVPPGPDTPWAAQPVAVFVRLPREETRLPLLALFLTQLLDALMALAEALPGRTLPAPTWFILDEFGNLPALPHFARHLTLLRSYGVRFVLAVQNLQQIAARYPEEHQIITDNCLTWVYLSTNSLETARQVSELAGQRTVLIRTTTTQAGGQGQSLAPTGRPLVTPDELLRWPRGVALVLQQGAPPLRVPTRPLAETPWRGALHPAVAPAPDPVPPVPVWPPPDPPAAGAWDAEPLPVDADSLPF